MTTEPAPVASTDNLSPSNTQTNFFARLWFFVAASATRRGQLLICLISGINLGSFRSAWPRGRDPGEATEAI